MGESQNHGMKEKQQRKQTIAFALLGGAMIAVILFITTIWASNRARISTRQAVSRVSEFYLEELAGRRAQVVSEELKNHVTYMKNAVDILEPSDLESQESLRSFLGKVKKLYGVDKFALVDENGIVYAQHSTTSGLSRYGFLSQELTEPVIQTQNLYGAKKQVILAIPVEDVFFQGLRIKICFTQINISEMLSSLTLQANDNETYCNLYYRNGESLTNDSFGYLTAGKNLLSELKEAEMKDGSSYEKLREDFDKGKGGQISFRYHGAEEDLCYVPVEGTNWVLTILIRNNVISDQIGSISSAMMKRSIIHIPINMIVILVLYSL